MEVALAGIALMGLIMTVQAIAVMRPRAEWTIWNVYGGNPVWYTAILFLIWDRDLGFRRRTVTHWVFAWGIWPAFGMMEMVCCIYRLL